MYAKFPPGAAGPGGGNYDQAGIVGDPGHTAQQAIDVGAGRSTGLRGFYADGFADDHEKIFDVAGEIEISKEQYEGISKQLDRMDKDFKTGKMEYSLNNGCQCASVTVKTANDNGIPMNPLKRLPTARIPGTGMDLSVPGIPGFLGGFVPQATSTTVGQYLENVGPTKSIFRPINPNTRFGR